LDLSSITAWLASLGLSQSTSLLAGAAIAVAVYFLKKKLGAPAAPVLPTSPASPATNPLDLAAQFPLLNRLLQGLGIVPKSGGGTTADIPHALLLQLDAEVEELKAARGAAHVAALADLGLIQPPTEARPAAPAGK